MREWLYPLLLLGTALLALPPHRGFSADRKPAVVGDVVLEEVPTKSSDLEPKNPTTQTTAQRGIPTGSTIELDVERLDDTRFRVRSVDTEKYPNLKPGQVGTAHEVIPEPAPATPSK